MKELKPKFYALNEEWYENEIKPFNIFNCNMVEYLKKYLDKNYTNFEAFKEKVRGELWYYYHSKAEYEMIYSDFTGKHEYKVSVYDQLLPNLDIIANIFFEEYNKHKRKKLEK